MYICIRKFVQGKEGHHVKVRASLLIGKIRKPIVCLNAMEEGKRLCNDRIFLTDCPTDVACRQPRYCVGALCVLQQSMLVTAEPDVSV